MFFYVFISLAIGARFRTLTTECHIRALMARLSFKKASGVATLVVALVGVCRLLVVYLESVSAVRAERAADAELLELCATGVARGSAKMREACLRAQAERAAPVFFKAIVRAVSQAWSEFASSCSSPLRFLLAVVFAVGVLAQPSVTWARLLLGMRRRHSAYRAVSDSDSDNDDEPRAHYVLLEDSGTDATASSLRRRVARLVPRLLGPRVPSEVARLRHMESGTVALPAMLKEPEWHNVPIDDRPHAD